jgi:hypothetical protein
MGRSLRVRGQQHLYTLIAVGLLLGFLCQVLVVDRWVSPVEAAGSPHDAVQFCHGSLSNCAGTVDVGSSLHAQLTPPLPPEPHPADLEFAEPLPPAAEHRVADSPPRSV